MKWTDEEIERATNLMFPDKEDVKPLLAAKWNCRVPQAKEAGR